MFNMFELYVGKYYKEILDDWEQYCAEEGISADTCGPAFDEYVEEWLFDQEIYGHNDVAVNNQRRAA